MAQAVTGCGILIPRGQCRRGHKRDDGGKYKNSHVQGNEGTAPSQ